MDWLIDLNENPLDIDTASVYGNGMHGPGDPLLQTNTADASRNELVEDVGESPDAIPIMPTVAAGSGTAAVHSGTMEGHSSSIPTGVGHDAGTDGGVDTNVNEAEAVVELEEEALSQPQEPFLGMRFDTLAGAREHYNAYAAKIGFSIKNNTNRRSVFTGEVEKQQFVCNKFKKPVVDDGVEKVAAVPKVNLEADDESNEEMGDGEDTCIFEDSKKKRPKKRKRQKIKPTACKAKQRWEMEKIHAYLRTPKRKGQRSARG